VFWQTVPNPEPRKNVYRLENTVRDYPWGSKTLMAEYLGRTPSGSPEAELWLGAHPGAPSLAGRDGRHTRLDDLIAADPKAMLGHSSRSVFGDKLPFLMKVLAADAPLSLQVHPTAQQAADGFTAEEASGIPVDGLNRNYKDSNHKPEMILALTEFDALCGFRPAAEAAAIFKALVSAFTTGGCEAPQILSQTQAVLSGGDESHAIGEAFAGLIRGGEDVSSAVDAVARQLSAGIPEGAFSDALRTAELLSRFYPGDPGVLVSLMLNTVHLQPGESVYLPAGNIHAYLRGLGIEVMASSDNVLRGGLTGKHVDVDELLKTVDFTPLPVPALTPARPREGQQIWQPPFEEFELHRVELAPGSSGIDFPAGAPLVVLAAAGAAVAASPCQSLELRRGESLFVRAEDGPFTLQAAGSEPLLAFVATTAAADSP
jgi:mannose-6-phosphate isomerase